MWVLVLPTGHAAIDCKPGPHGAKRAHDGLAIYWLVDLHVCCDGYWIDKMPDEMRVRSPSGPEDQRTYECVDVGNRFS
jgi:hypothetical protein